MKTAAYLIFLIIYLLILFIYSANNTVTVLANPLAAFGLVILGAYLSAFMANRARLVIPRYTSIVLQSLAGGFLMGLGFTIAGLPQLFTTLVMVHGVFYWVSLLMPQGFLYVGAVFLGGGAATLLQKYFYPKLSFTVLPVHIQKSIGKWARPFYRALSLLVLLVCVKLVMSGPSPWLGLAGVFLALSSGFLLERNRFCMGLMMKEIYFTKTMSTLMKMITGSLVLGAAWRILDIGGIGGYSTPVSNYPALLTGSFLMGFGFIMADGCYMGSLWKAGQGNIASFISVIGIILGAGVSSAVQNLHLEIGAFSAAEINLTWPIMAAKVGLALFFLVWVGAYLMEQPEQIVKSGSKKVWLFSEAIIIVTLITILAGQKAAFSTTLLVMGLMLYYAGIALYIWARMYLGKYWGEAIVLRTGHKIVTQGPYKYFKHPIYIAITLSLTGVSLLLRSPWGLGGTYLLTVPLLILRAKEEEQLLSELPGADKYFKSKIS